MGSRKNETRETGTLQKESLLSAEVSIPGTQELLLPIQRLETGSGIVKSNVPSDPTAREGMLRAYYSQHIELIDRCIAKIEPALQTYIRKGVTEGLSYRSLRARGCPCGSQMYYDFYRKFFWLLSIERQ